MARSMHAGRCAVLGLGLGLGLSLPAEGDVWDVQTVNDNGLATRNELSHGADQVHDLGALPGPDQDWYRFAQAPRSSYEVVVDGTSGDIGAGSGPILQRIGPDGTTILQDSAPVGVGSGRSLRWQNLTSSAVTGEYIRVTSASCTSSCGPDDVYRIRAYETTYAIPRYNNSGSQITVLSLQNPSTGAVTGTAYFWDVTGALLATQVLNVAARGLVVLNTSTIPALAGTGGTVTVATDGRYGELKGKTVSLEPSTGFSFDTPLLARPSVVAAGSSAAPAAACDPDDTYLLTSGGPIVYTCCSGFVNVNISSFTFTNNGSSVTGAPSFGQVLMGAPTTCPSGAFNAAATVAGSCTETYRLMGAFTGADTWNAAFTMIFTGAGCSGGACAGDPCLNQTFPVTGTR